MDCPLNQLLLQEAQALVQARARAQMVLVPVEEPLTVSLLANWGQS
jgi:hypothetical protein